MMPSTTEISVFMQLSESEVKLLRRKLASAQMSIELFQLRAVKAEIKEMKDPTWPL